MIDGRGAVLGLRGAGGTEGYRGAAPPASPPTRRQVVVVVVGSSAAPARLGGVDFSINSPSSLAVLGSPSCINEVSVTVVYSFKEFLLKLLTKVVSVQMLYNYQKTCTNTRIYSFEEVREPLSPCR